MQSDVEVQDLPAAMMNYEENVKDLERNCRNNKKVHDRYNFPVIL